TILLLLISVFVSSCRGYEGEGDVVIKDTSVSKTFTGISSGISADFYIMQGSEAKIIVHGQQNIIDVLDMDVDNNTLSIGFKKNNVRNYERLKFYVTMAALEKLNISGSGKMLAADSIKTSVMDLDISGSGDIQMDKLLATSKVKANISGSGNIKIAGTAENTEFNISGSGSIFSFGLICKNADAHISGSGDIETNVTDKLDAHISGSGDIRYKGRPVVNTDISGSGKISHIE
ncbi:MAG: head GIN domain-containing protein, partial [Bacteroidia bacterium]